MGHLADLLTDNEPEMQRLHALSCFLYPVLYSAYLNHLAEEVNDKLQEAGLISMAELCKSYDLPGDFLTEVSHLMIIYALPQVQTFSHSGVIAESSI